MLKLVKDQEKIDCPKFREIIDDVGIPVSGVTKSVYEFHDAYHLTPARGFRISKVEAVLPEIGMFLRASEVPSGKISMSDGCYTVTVRKSYPENPDMIRMIRGNSLGLGMPTSIGLDLFGNDIAFDLSKIPNLIVAGATGSGKSVVLNNIILSGIASGSRMFLIDPKYVEFSAYRDVKGVAVCHTIEDMKMILSVAMSFAKNRFKRLSSAGCRNVSEFNERFDDKMKNIIIVIDEWADLVMTDRSVEKDLCSLAQ